MDAPRVDDASCSITRDEIEAWLDGELAGVSRDEMAHHVPLCARCSREAESLRRLRELLRDEDPILVPDDLQPRTAPRLLVRNQSWLLAAAGVVLAATTWILAPWSPRSPEPVSPNSPTIEAPAPSELPLVVNDEPTEDREEGESTTPPTEPVGEAALSR